MLPAFYEHVQLDCELLYVAFLSVKNYIKASCYDLEVGEITAKGFQILVGCSIYFDRIDRFKMNRASAHSLIFFYFCCGFYSVVGADHLVVLPFADPFI